MDADEPRPSGQFWLLADERGALAQVSGRLWRLSSDLAVAREVDLGEWEARFPLIRTPRGTAFMAWRPASTLGVTSGVVEIDARDQPLTWVSVDHHHRSFSFDSEGRLYLPSDDPDHYLRRFDGDRWEPWGTRNWAREELEPFLVGHPPAGHHVAIIGEEVHVVDAFHGALVTFDLDGERRRASRLPALLAEALISRTASETPRVAIRGFTPLPGGGLALTTASGVGADYLRLFLIDPADHSVQPVHLGAGPGASIQSQPSFRGDRLLGFGTGPIVYEHAMIDEPLDPSRARALQQERNVVLHLHLCREWVESAEAYWQIDGSSVQVHLDEEPAHILERFATANPWGRVRVYYGSDPVEDSETAWLRIPSEGALGWHRMGWPLEEAEAAARTLSEGSDTCLFDASEFPRGSHEDRNAILERTLLELDDLHAELARGREEEVADAPRRLDLLIHASSGLVGRYSHEWANERIREGIEASHGIVATCEGEACEEEGTITVRVGPVTWKGPERARVAVMLRPGGSARPVIIRDGEWALEFLQVDGEWRLVDRIDRR